MAEIIVLRNLNKVYGEIVKTEVLKKISYGFEQGKFTAIIGPSGSGKSTLLNIIGLLERPTSGQLIIDGQDFSEGEVNDYSEYRNKNIGFIFQFHYLLPEFTVIENVLLPVWIKSGRPDEKILKKAMELMAAINLAHLKNKYPNEISGGEQQRTAIARALINSPKIVLADEPTGNLDRETGFAVLEVMTKMIQELGTTLIMVTHDREIALRAERIVELVDGQICRSFMVKEQGKDKVKQLLEERSCVFSEG
ncbi:MAG: ABC transporter ATP-binding protein [Candidatus Aminicenantes bacterium]|nr:ABC transporter ATP-binding protein [Candidatus Aminicenantes bacterium]